MKTAVTEWNRLGWIGELSYVNPFFSCCQNRSSGGELDARDRDFVKHRTRDHDFVKEEMKEVEVSQRSKVD